MLFGWARRQRLPAASSVWWGGGNNLLNSAVRACRQAPVRLEEDVDEVKQAQYLVGKHLVAVATAGG
ncbi:hypothetical protein ACGFIR_21505 [Micromonospora sp. NPDC049051]|uniref:hypothetical protein n=1 Tax=Micromonospora sp. NPDC049051 TaxID=3364264 RepID=UPI0037130EC1